MDDLVAARSGGEALLRGLDIERPRGGKRAGLEGLSGHGDSMPEGLQPLTGFLALSKSSLKVGRDDGLDVVVHPKERVMTQFAEARNIEPVEPAEIPFDEHVARTAHAVAAGHDAALNRALETVSWERRGLLGALSRRPRPVRVLGSGG